MQQENRQVALQEGNLVGFILRNLVSMMLNWDTPFMRCFGRRMATKDHLLIFFFFLLHKFKILFSCNPPMILQVDNRFVFLLEWNQSMNKSMYF